jgi:hypothetical protein
MSYPYPPPSDAGFMSAHAPPTYSYPPPLIYTYPPPQTIHSGGQTIHSGGVEHSGGRGNTSQTTQALARTKKRNEWTHEDEKKLVGLKFTILLSFF